ncbi:hypothetical protein GC176_22060 [bacterium]|nr:hypothetical protein [bacterium]
MIQFLRTVIGATCLLLTVAPTFAADGFFLAIGGINGKADDGHVLEGQFGTIYRSTDGEAWTEVFKGGPVTEDFNHARNNLLRCATYGNGRFVVTGNPHAVIVSEDGGKWRVVEAPSGSMSVEFGNGMFLAPNASQFMVSTDGLKWETRKPEVDFPIWGKDGAGHVRKTVFGNGVFVCVGEQRIGVTRDGSSWLYHQLLPAAERPGRNILLFGNGRFVWLCEKTGPHSSVDGITWEPITTFGELSEKAVFGQSGVFDGNQFLASPSAWNDKNKIIYASHDGVKWTPAVEHAQATSFSTAGNGRLLQNQGWSKSFTLSADGGKTWKQIKADIPSRQVYFFDGQRIIGQSGG